MLRSTVPSKDATSGTTVRLFWRTCLTRPAWYVPYSDFRLRFFRSAEGRAGAWMRVLNMPFPAPTDHGSRLQDLNPGARCEHAVSDGFGVLLVHHGQGCVRTLPITKEHNPYQRKNGNCAHSQSTMPEGSTLSALSRCVVFISASACLPGECPLLM